MTRVTRLVHLGPGAFFRAFNAPYTQDAGGDWGILAVSLRSSGLRDILAGQDHRYMAASLGPDGLHPRVIDVINGVLVAPEDPQAVLEVMADPKVEVVSLTITEKGYCHDPANGRIKFDHPEIVHDLKMPARPKSAIGFLTQALAMRRAEGLPAFTVLSCDNLPDNGALTARVVAEFARELDPDLADWIAEHARFPATMVDRITPATTEADIARLEAETGVRDPACVVHEPFRQWVIEDDFVGGRPDWDARFVSDVTSFETMKLRCLNGTHSALAYLGYLAGFETISQTVGDAGFERFLEYLWAVEIVPSVPLPEGEDLQAYCAALLQRYRNPAIAHRTWQIAMDGSQKLPQRILGTITDNLANGRQIKGLALVVAAWMRYVGGTDDAGQPIDVRDPMADELGRVARRGGASELMGIRSIFSQALAQNETFRDEVCQAYATLEKIGAKRAVATFNA